MLTSATEPVTSRSDWKRIRSGARSARSKRSSSRSSRTAARETRDRPSRQRRRSRAPPGSARTVARLATSRPTRSTYAPVLRKQSNPQKSSSRSPRSGDPAGLGVTPQRSAAAGDLQRNLARATSSGTHAVGDRAPSKVRWRPPRFPEANRDTPQRKSLRTG